MHSAWVWAMGNAKHVVFLRWIGHLSAKKCDPDLARNREPSCTQLPHLVLLHVGRWLAWRIASQGQVTCLEICAFRNTASPFSMHQDCGVDVFEVQLCEARLLGRDRALPRL